MGTSKLNIHDADINYLAKVCEYSSINVTQLCALESFETVHHLVSTIEGKLRANQSPIDLLKATVPGGSITQGQSEVTVRFQGEFQTIKDIREL